MLPEFGEGPSSESRCELDCQMMNPLWPGFSSGWPLLLVHYGNYTVLEMFLIVGVNTNNGRYGVKDHERSVLFWAVYQREMEAIRLLLQYGADPLVECLFLEQVLAGEVRALNGPCCLLQSRFCEHCEQLSALERLNPIPACSLSVSTTTRYSGDLR